MTDTARAPVLAVDMTYGGIYAGTSFEFSSSVAEHFNSAAERARGVADGEFEVFEPGEYFSIACPMARAWPVADFVAAYHQLDAVIDGEIEIHLGDHPRLFSNHPDDPSLIRAVPTYVPKSVMPEGFFGKPHDIEILQDGRSLFGPQPRFFHTRTSGSLFSHIEDGEGRLVSEIGGDLSMLAEKKLVIFFTDPVFGEPTGATQLHADGRTTDLPYRILGRDHVGDVMLFNEGVVSGVEPEGDRTVLALNLPQTGTGLAAALYSGHTRDLAFRTDARVL